MVKGFLRGAAGSFLFLVLAAAASCVSRGDTSSQPLVLSNLEMTARVTGAPLPGEDFPAPNDTRRYDVWATDLGVMWHMEGDRVGIFFGDTDGSGFTPQPQGGGNGTNRRSNTLAFSEDTDLSDGLSISGWALDGEGKAREICAGAKTGNIEGFNTSIPTGAVRAAGVDYIHYMNIYKWDMPDGRWLTHFSSLYSSRDGGENWQREESVVFDPDSHFSQIAYAKRDGWVYMLGTQSGRHDDARLARFREKDILDKDNYCYWNGSEWVEKDENAAVPVFGKPVGETSLMYLEKQRRWIVTYLLDHNFDPAERYNGHSLVYRESPDLVNWSKPRVITDNREYPGLYCAYMHPLKNDGDKLWFLMSLWQPYNVFLMSADISLGE